MDKNISDQDFRLFITAVKQVSEYDFSDYSEKSLKRMVAKVISDNKTDINTLVSEISKNKEFLESVIKKITVNTTELFRDPRVWQEIRNKVLPALSAFSTINIWHAGCSTGQEVYSMLILLSEMGLFEKSRVLATDINSDVLEDAKQGIYRYRFNRGYIDNFNEVICKNPLNHEERRDVPWSRYFSVDNESDTLSMSRFLLEKPVFKKHDLVSGTNSHPGKFDLIICRNVVIYFNPELQNRIFEFFYDNLHHGGFLVIGAHETLAGPMSRRYVKSGHTYTKQKRV